MATPLMVAVPEIVPAPLTAVPGKILRLLVAVLDLPRIVLEQQVDPDNVVEIDPKVPPGPVTATFATPPPVELPDVKAPALVKEVGPVALVKLVIAATTELPDCPATLTAIVLLGADRPSS